MGLLLVGRKARIPKPALGDEVIRPREPGRVVAHGPLPVLDHGLSLYQVSALSRVVSALSDLS
jgi:hypothetical protein